jgi:hypothetical protein
VVDQREGIFPGLNLCLDVLRLKRPRVLSQSLGLLSPLGPQNAVHSHLEVVVVKPFGLAQYAFLLQTCAIANSLTWIVVGSSSRLNAIQL